jgi:GNAT superfamily N-acetyltransferase
MPLSPSAPPSGYAVQPLPSVTVDEVLQHYEDLTFPPIARRLAVRRPTGAWLGAVALGTSGPVGLGLAQERASEAGASVAQVVSLAVLPGHRGKRVGSALLAALEGVAADAGARAVEASYRTSWRSREAIEAMLRARGWSSPETRMVLARGETGVARGLLRRPAPALPEEVEIFSWEQLSEAEARAVVERQSRQPWYPEILTPFQDAPRLEPTISVGLRHRGEVAGWMICHRVSHDTLQYSAFHLREDLRGGGLGFALLREAVRRRLADPDVRYTILAVDARNRKVRAWVEERFRPYLASTSELRVSRKTLGD